MTALVALLCARPVAAGALSFTLKDGRVTILAYSVTVKEILNEWGRFGGISIAGSDALSGAPITLELRDVPEAKALDVLLRSVSGYVAVSRNQAVATGSIFQSIRILPTSRAPALPQPVVAGAAVPRAPVSTAFVPPPVPPGPIPFRPPVAPVAISGGSAARMEPVVGQAVPAAGTPPRPVSISPTEQAERALQDFLAKAKAGNSTPATTLSPPVVSTDASRPGSITPYTPPSNPRPGSPPVPRP